MMDRETVLELIPAYTLDALDEEERQAVEALIATDPEAQSLLADYEAVSAFLPLAAPMRQAPAHLQSDLKAKLASRSESPAVKPEIAQKDEKASKTIAFPTWLIAAAAVIAVAIIGGLVFILSQQPNEATPGLILYNEITTSSEFARFEVTPNETFEVVGELVVSADGQQSVLRIESLPNRSSSESYQLWLITESERHSGGIFYWETGHGPYYVIINTPASELARIGMSIEPEGGSPLGNEPTGPLLFGVEIAQAR